MIYEEIESGERTTDRLTAESLSSLNTLDFEVQANLKPLLDHLNSELGTNMQAREEGYHVTIISPTESKVLQSLPEDKITELQKISESIQKGEGIRITGIGYLDPTENPERFRAADQSKQTCYLSLEIPALQEFRFSLAITDSKTGETKPLPPKDFHVTLGFEGGDIHMEVAGKDEKGKDLLRSIRKLPDERFQQIWEAFEKQVPIKFRELGGQEK